MNLPIDLPIDLNLRFELPIHLQIDLPIDLGIHAPTSPPINPPINPSFYLPMICQYTFELTSQSISQSTSQSNSPQSIREHPPIDLPIDTHFAYIFLIVHTHSHKFCMHCVYNCIPISYTFHVLSAHICSPMPVIELTACMLISLLYALLMLFCVRSSCSFYRVHSSYRMPHAIIPYVSSVNCS